MVAVAPVARAVVTRSSHMHLENFFWGGGEAEYMDYNYGRGPLGAQRFCTECIKVLVVA